MFSHLNPVGHDSVFGEVFLVLTSSKRAEIAECATHFAHRVCSDGHMDRPVSFRHVLSWLNQYDPSLWGFAMAHMRHDAPKGRVGMLWVLVRHPNNSLSLHPAYTKDQVPKALSDFYKLEWLE